MKTIRYSSRRKFLGTGGLVFAASALGGAASLFGKEEEKKNEQVSPPEDLMREHGVLKRILLVYGEALRRMDANEDLPPEPLADSARSFANSWRIITRNWRRTFFSRVSKK